MDPRKQAIQAFQPVKTFEIERNDGREGGRARRQELEALPVVKVDKPADALAVDDLSDRGRQGRTLNGFKHRRR